MNHFLFRLSGSLAVIMFSALCTYTPVLAGAKQIKLNSTQKTLADLEASSGGRIGLSAINIANKMRIQYRAEERFPVCSTFKTMAVAAVLKKSMTENQLLQQYVAYTHEDVKAAHYSPITEKHLESGMTVSELCAATIQHSDNAAVNLLMKILGGPEAVTVFARSIGDNTFRLDRWEPELNSAIPGDIRDTSTPAAMEESLQRIVLGDALATPQREQFQIWLKGNTTGNTRIRAGVPKHWTVGDKTGTGSYGTTNDVGVIWPMNGSPIVLAVYFTQNREEAAPNNDVIAAVTHIVISAFNEIKK